LKGPFAQWKWIETSFGGRVCALLERLEARNKPWREMDASHDFLEYAKRLYHDFAGFSGGMHAFRLAYGMLGPSRILFGSDFPQDFTKGEEIEKYMAEIRKIVLEKDYETMMSTNAVNLFRLSSSA
jgi:predicted TIM-barrel fold metal-dependent hydrolase